MEILPKKKEDTKKLGWLGLTFGSGVIIYAFSLRCKSCGALQVFRGISIFSLRWPQDNCWKCGYEIR